MAAHDERSFDRRTILRGAAGGGLSLLAAGLLGLTSDDDDAAWAADLAAACVLTPELTEGPFYVDRSRMRQNVREGRPGLRLRLRTIVVDTRTCTRLPGAAVDIWHCDAGGTYSGVQGDAGTFLRGIQLTNARGLAFFETIYPGWYPGRATHVHLKVHVGGTRLGGTYSGGHVAHTGQIFFPDATTDVVMRRPAYRGRSGSRTRNAADGIYAQAGTSSVARLARLDAGRLAAGYLATVVLGVDPGATPAAV